MKFRVSYEKLTLLTIFATKEIKIMKLDQFEYISNRGEPNEWRIDLTGGQASWKAYVA